MKDRQYNDKKELYIRTIEKEQRGKISCRRLLIRKIEKEPREEISGKRS
jgi:hypothetical protein